MHKYKIINKFRFCTCFFLTLTLICMILFITIVDAKDNDEHNLISVSIRQGDTLWQLASKYAEQDTDIRDYINKIININELKTVNIKPGQILYFPNNSEFE